MKLLALAAFRDPLRKPSPRVSKSGTAGLSALLRRSLIYHYDDFLDKAKAFLRSISPSSHSLATAASLFILDGAGVSVLV